MIIIYSYYKGVVIMYKSFGYPQFNEQGEQILTTYDNEYSNMLMDIRVYRLTKGQTKTFIKHNEETAILLLSGKLTYNFEDKSETVSRKDVFSEAPYCLHFCTDIKVSILAHNDVEILVQSTKNTTIFPTKLYTPTDVPWGYSCVGKFGDTAKRQVNTIFDYDTAPYSNMVIGEVINDRGNWSGYLPHRHPQPEVYYFKFDRPEGFGASFIGNDVFKSIDSSFAAIADSKTHPQAVAPGFLMYTCWMIRHFDNNPWLRQNCNEDERYIWLHDAKF